VEYDLAACRIRRAGGRSSGWAGEGSHVNRNDESRPYTGSSTASTSFRRMLPKGRTRACACSRFPAMALCAARGER
jgi:hypothetical protein